MRATTARLHVRQSHKLLAPKRRLKTDVRVCACAFPSRSYPGLEGNFEMDAQTLAFDFEIDSIKVDACNANESNFDITCPAFEAALNQTKRPAQHSVFVA